jgi:hypothetical protein
VRVGLSLVRVCGGSGTITCTSMRWEWDYHLYEYAVRVGLSLVRVCGASGTITCQSLVRVRGASGTINYKSTRCEWVFHLYEYAVRVVLSLVRVCGASGTILVRVRGASGVRISAGTSTMVTKVVRDFPQPHHPNFGAASQSISNLVPSKSIPIHYSLNMITFYTM